MIALDTSALLRYLTNDDPDLAARAAALIDSDTPIGVASVVLLETAYALRTPRYGRDNPEIADALVDFLSRRNVVVTDLNGDLVRSALLGTRHLSARHIADALVAAAAREAGAERLVTSDERFASRLVPVSQLRDEPLG